MKLIALYKQPEDVLAFEDAYFNTHLPLIARVPGLQRTVITRFNRTLVGDGFYLMAEMYFTDESALRSGLKSPEMVTAGENLDTFASGLVTLMLGSEEGIPVVAS